MHGHAHSHGHASHDHGTHTHAAPSMGKRLFLALGLTLSFSLIEALTGLWSGSIALLSDAGHMLTDAIALFISSGALLLSRRPATLRHTYGLGRVETLAALANTVFMLLVVAGIIVAAIKRFNAPMPIAGSAVAIVAVLGLLINGLVAWLLSQGEQSLNTRSALLHVMGDLLGSVAALISGLVILFTGWLPIDPLLSIVSAALILVSSLRLFREVILALLEGVPSHLVTENIAKILSTISGVRSIHDLHIWALSSTQVLLSAHLVVDSLEAWPKILEAAGEALQKEGINHATLQPEVHIYPIQWIAPPPSGTAA